MCMCRCGCVSVRVHVRVCACVCMGMEVKHPSQVSSSDVSGPPCDLMLYHWDPVAHLCGQAGEAGRPGNPRVLPLPSQH